jgi:hypothetical protein
MNCPHSTLVCDCWHCRAARRAAAWQCAGVMVLIWCLGFAAACVVIGHYFFPTP